MTLLLIIIIAILLIALISTKLGLTAYVAWMEENHFKQPSQNILSPTTIRGVQCGGQEHIGEF